MQGHACKDTACVTACVCHDFLLSALPRPYALPAQSYQLMGEIAQHAKYNRLQPAIQAFQSAVQEGVTLNPGVYNTLLYISSGGNNWEAYVRGKAITSVVAGVAAAPDAAAAAGGAAAATGEGLQADAAAATPMVAAAEDGSDATGGCLLTFTVQGSVKGSRRRSFAAVAGVKIYIYKRCAGVLGTWVVGVL